LVRGSATVTATETKYEIIELDDLTDDQAMIVNIFIREGMLREQERIIAKLNTLSDITCCCDTSTFGNHYLSHQQPDNLIDFIKKD
jgi:hypothetical protein